MLSTSSWESTGQADVGLASCCRNMQWTEKIPNHLTIPNDAYEHIQDGVFHLAHPVVFGHILKRNLFTI